MGDSPLIEGGGLMMSRLQGSDWHRMAQSARQAKASVESLAGGGTKGGKTETDELHRACQQLESVFLGYLLKEMRKTVQSSGLIPQSCAHEIYMSMFDDEVAKAASERGGIGLADLVFSSLVNKTEEPAGKGEKESAEGPSDESAKVVGLTLR